MAKRDFYEVLGVSRTADDGALKSAFRKLAMQLHPDKNPGDAPSEEKFKEVAAAYDVLGDDTKRKEYDEVRSMGPAAMGGRGGGPGGFTFNVDDMGGAGGLGGNPMLRMLLQQWARG